MNRDGNKISLSCDKPLVDNLRDLLDNHFNTATHYIEKYMNLILRLRMIPVKTISLKGEWFVMRLPGS